jgi:hypothetical protein
MFEAISGQLSAISLEPSSICHMLEFISLGCLTAES